jgi:uncharacterized protein (DUF1015 family)
VASTACPTSTTWTCAEGAIADVRALPGIRYADAARLTELVSPPYDVIPEADVAKYAAWSPNNVVRLIRPGADYAAAARRLDEWLASGVLREDGPSMYVHEVETGGRVRRDLIAALRLEAYEAGVVLPHERTHKGPKEDRLALMRATRASLEPLWFVYDGRGSGLSELLASGVAEQASAAEFVDPDGLKQRLWAIPAGRWTDSVRAALAELPLLIADGHHRYETSLAYSEEADGTPDAASRFTLALLTDVDDPGLQVAPTHRVMKAGIAVTGGEPAGSLEEVLAAIDGQVAAGVYRDGRYQVLPLEGEVAVVELHRQVIDNLLGRRSAEDFLLYTRDAREAVRWVDEGAGVSAFFLPPPDLRAVLKLAQEGKTLPQKSTYFHPKPPSGMVIHRLDADRIL